MSDLHYSLNYREYTVKNALLWGNFRGHCALVMEGSWGHRIVHVGVAFIEFWPIISQIASLFEMLIVKSCLFNAIIDKRKANGSPRKVRKLTPPDLVGNLDPKKIEFQKQEDLKESGSISKDELPKVVNDDPEPGEQTSGKGSPAASDDSFSSIMSSDSDTPVPITITAEMQLERAKLKKQDLCPIT